VGVLLGSLPQVGHMMEDVLIVSKNAKVMDIIIIILLSLYAGKIVVQKLHITLMN
jgi:hypothetical protein